MKGDGQNPSSNAANSASGSKFAGSNAAPEVFAVGGSSEAEAKARTKGGKRAFAAAFANDRSGAHSSRANTFSLLLAIDFVPPGKAAPATRP